MPKILYGIASKIKFICLFNKEKEKITFYFNLHTQKKEKQEKINNYKWIY